MNGILLILGLAMGALPGNAVAAPGFLYRAPWWSGVPGALQEPDEATLQEPPPSPAEAAVALLQRIYARIHGLGHVQVRYEDGILELTGAALTLEDRDKAIALARDVVPGVIYVDHRGLMVESDVRRRLEPAIERLQEKGTAFLRFLPALLVGLLLLVVGAAAAWWLGEWSFLERVIRQPFALAVVRHALRGVAFLVALLLALDLMGVTALVGAVLGAAGVFGIAVGFAFRDIVENYLAGLILSIRQPFGPNDHIQMAGEEGRVVRLTGRETILMTLDGNHVRIPNATVFKSVMTNLTRNPRRRFMSSVGIAPWEDLGHAIRVARDAVASVPGVLETPPPAIRVQELQDSGIQLRLTGWVDQREADFGKVRSRVLRAVKEAFEREGVATPPPEYGIRILEGRPGESGGRRLPAASPEDAAPPPARGTSAKGVPLQTPPAAVDPSRSLLSGSPSPDGPSEPTREEADISPDRTIEEEIARELQESAEENLLGRGDPR